jgi:phosphoglycerate dehydrogenase-like enzyme
VSCRDINTTVGEASPKSALVGLGVLGTTVNVDPKAIEMDVLALNHADHHPAEGF